MWFGEKSLLKARRRGVAGGGECGRYDAQEGVLLNQWGSFHGDFNTLAY